MSTTTPCPTCKGFCCANHNETFAPSLRYRHSGMKWHSCPDCYDGIHEICPDPEPATEPVRTAEEERADALAWLWDVGTSPAMSADEMVTLHWVARALHGGEHVGAAAKREKP